MFADEEDVKKDERCFPREVQSGRGLGAAFGKCRGAWVKCFLVKEM